MDLSDPNATHPVSHQSAWDRCNPAPAPRLLMDQESTISKSQGWGDGDHDNDKIILAK